VFPICTFVWHQATGVHTKVLITGFHDGSIQSRVLIVGASGTCPVDKIRVYGPDIDPDRVWTEVERVVTFINEAPIAWARTDPIATTYLDFLDLDEAVKAAEADARAAGLLAVSQVH
jgi:hypothetical protein